MSWFKSKYFYVILGSILMVLLGALTISATDLVDTDRGDEPKEAWLGVYMQDVTASIAEAMDLQVHKGVLIDDVIEDSPAEKAGLKNGDVIIRVDDQVIDAGKDLSAVINEKKPGDKIEISIIRDGKKDVKATVTLGEAANSGDLSIFMKKNPSGKYSRKFAIGSSGGGYIGVMLQSLSSQLAEYFGVESGVLITEVEKDSPAQEAGLKAGDVIQEIDGKEIESSTDISGIIGEHKNGDKIVVSVMRRGTMQKLTVEIAERENNFGDSPWGALSPSNPIFGIYPPGNNLGQLYFDTANGNWKEWGEELRQEMKQYKEEFQKEMESYREQMEKMKEELQQMKKDLH